MHVTKQTNQRHQVSILQPHILFIIQPSTIEPKVHLASSNRNLTLNPLCIILYLMHWNIWFVLWMSQSDSQRLFLLFNSYFTPMDLNPVMKPCSPKVPKEIALKKVITYHSLFLTSHIFLSITTGFVSTSESAHIRPEASVTCCISTRYGLS